MPIARQFRSNTWMGGTGGMWQEVKLSGAGASHDVVLGDYVNADVTAGNLKVVLPDQVIGGDVVPVRKLGTGNSLVVLSNTITVEDPASLGSYSSSVTIADDNVTMFFVYNQDDDRWQVEISSASGAVGLPTSYAQTITWRPGGTLDADNLIASTFAEVQTLKSAAFNRVVVKLDATLLNTFALSGTGVDYTPYEFESLVDTSSSFQPEISITDGVTGTGFLKFRGNLKISRTGTSATAFYTATGAGAPAVFLCDGSVEIDNQNANSGIFDIGGTRTLFTVANGRDLKFGNESNHPIIKLTSDTCTVSLTVGGTGASLANNAVNRNSNPNATVNITVNGMVDKINPLLFDPTAGNGGIFGKSVPYYGKHAASLYQSGSFTLDEEVTYAQVSNNSPFTCTLPAIAEVENRQFVIQNIRLSSAVCTISRAGTDTFDGGPTSIEINPGDTAIITGQGSTWNYTIIRDPIKIAAGVVSAGGSTASYNRIQLVDPSGGTFTLNTPPNPQNYGNGVRFGVKNSTNSATAITISAGADNIEVIGTPGTYANSTSFSGAGKSVLFELKDVAGTPTWIIVSDF